MIAASQSGPVAHQESLEQRQIDSLVAWLVDGARSGADAHAFVDGLCRRLAAAGIPLDRFGLFIDTLHPNVAARRFLWTPAGGVTLLETAHSLFSQDRYLETPLPLVTSRQTSVRRILTGFSELNAFSILTELFEEGFTDYLAQPLIFTTGETHAASFSTRHPAGFTEDQLAALERVRQPLARVVEAHLLRMNAACIISAYVGRGSGIHILQGRVRRGDGEEIAAAILFAHLIGFAELSNQLTDAQIVAMLNDAFDVVVPVLQAHGGEILKFLGDGRFAIFPYGQAKPVEDTVRDAMAAIMEGEAELAAAAISQGIAFRWAPHAGRFHYGNIGGATRRGFTAIGRPVNYAARLLAAASNLSLGHVASAAVAEHVGAKARVAAEVAFKGRQKIYTF